MVRAVLNHLGRKILLEEGETLIGRGLHCGIRFNDTAVSREHVRIVVAVDQVRLENLSRSNGTTLNGELMAGPRVLANGDAIGLGYHILNVELVAQPGKQGARPIALDRDAHAGPGLLIDEQSVAEEATRPGNHPAFAPAPADRARSKRPGSVSDAVPEPVPTDPVVFAGLRNCRGCRAALSDWDTSCARCGAAVPQRVQSVDTQRIKLEDIRARAAPRFSTDVPVIYSSDSMTFDATVRDLSEGGMFIATELLDAVGTECHLAVLPDGYPAATFSGIVVHVSHEASETGRPPGLGVRFVASSPAGDRWLAAVIAAARRAPPG